ncbi:hypothetical protein GIB67_035036 [Kingdonia uniflora]|uniref:CCHC-type domain-containing protein n=1 Tax=Kingdonia uniflora TaxID=39325 RepID=A0A7J7L1N3_9MAGN|nr:hypothetical protein GIB67_035036 [Kingdonia uniflora]
MYGKETLSFEGVTSTLLSEERRINGSRSFVENSTMVVSGNRSFNRFRNGTCWSCGQSGHYRSDCKWGKDRKSAVKDDILPDGLRVKKGDGIIYVPYAMGRMTFIWGEDAEDFFPGRWIVNGVFQPESPFKFSAFQAGPRVCLGKDFAYRQMKIFAAILLNFFKFFKFKLVDEQREAKYRTMFTLHMDNGLQLFASHRRNVF